MIDAFPGQEDFAELVNNEARNKVTDQEVAWLRESYVVDSWHKQLIMLLNKVDAQLSHHKAERAAKRVDLGAEEDRVLYLEYVKQAEAWRAQALWFRKVLLDRLLEAKALIQYYRNYEAYDHDVELDEPIDTEPVEVGKYHVSGSVVDG